MFKYIWSSFPFSGNTTKRARMKQNSIPYIFKINISGRRDNYTDVLISLRYRQLKNFGNLNIFISIYSEKKTKSTYNHVLLQQNKALFIQSKKAEEADYQRYSRYANIKFYYLTPKDRRLNPQQTNRSQAWPIPSCLQKVPVNSCVH